MSGASPALGATSPMARRIAIAAATIGVIYGYDIGNISGALLFITEEMDLSPALQGSVTTVLVAGNIVGALLAGKLATAIGRKATMLLVVAGYAVFAVWSGLASDILWLDVSRFFLGISIGLSLVVTPIFLAESAPAAIRGALVVGYQVATVTGILIAYLVDWSLADSGNWRLMLALSAVPSVLVMFLLVKLPDTARWYVLKGRHEEARRTLQLVDPGADTDRELAEIRADIESRRGGQLTEMFRKPYATATTFVLVLGFLVQITGINAITYYSPMIFKEMGFQGNATVIGLPAIVQGAALLATIGSLFVVDRVGRRPILLGGIATMAVSSLAMILVFATGSLDGGGSWWGFAAILVFTAGFNFGFGSLVWVFASESFPARLRALGASLMLTADLVANLIVAQFFLPIMDGLGGATTFAIFLALAAISWVFVLRFAPETKGRSLESIRTYWENGARWPSGS
ncbi:MFS transporter, sugar porter (SP) family [Saccharopolyspora antimicrobica]|uniref:MFS transporter, sugar porter (SP) family n=1 Tax=Saccharopolyspora antimicrobica TaxID=455193 RepID=A0A1I4TPN8_9PSEU|nr:sugar porter family MFS transporter [Saccharopolyspora antimicrobica]RKT88500.1 sugar porter (SP) family MFS transporter [Saccharopolyspora antimicrobica]SFM78702.1 MFS transporter, sugar porter (SP) family [Saccharopolyspora antimicrobica]